MKLPIYYPDGPFLPKYLDEETPMFARWMIFGEGADGSVGLADIEGDVVANIPRDKAEAIIRLRNSFVDGVLKIINGES